MTVAEILEDALSYLQEHGWCQKHYENYAGNVCVMGAVYKIAEPLDHATDDVYEVVNYDTLLSTRCRRALEKIMGEPPGHYNDTHTQAEVEERIRETIAAEKVVI